MITLPITIEFGEDEIEMEVEIRVQEDDYYFEVESMNDIAIENFTKAVQYEIFCIVDTKIGYLGGMGKVISSYKKGLI